VRLRSKFGVLDGRSLHGAPRYRELRDTLSGRTARERVATAERRVTVEFAALGSRFLLAFVLILASIPKLASREEFAQAVANYRLLPRFLVSPVSRWLPRLELAAGVALLAGTAVGPASVLVAVMLLLFAAAVAWNLLQGRKIECGCAGSAVPREISWQLVIRDVVLAAVALFVAFAWFEGVAVAFPWSSDAGGAGAADVIAVVFVAALVVVGESVLVGALRARAALRAFEEARSSA
jgi:uncharacterized membrane protein YphA (DoxX/SURF4 family)